MAHSPINQPHFQDAEAARKHLEAIRWPTGPICPHCGVINEATELKGKSTRPGVWKCRPCGKPFSVTVGTVFERSKIPLHIWFQAVYWLCSSKKGVSSLQLQRMLGVTYKTAWFMTHRIREAMKIGSGVAPIGGFGTAVEMDETYVGGKEHNKHRNKRVRGSQGHRAKGKVFALVQRKGELRSFHVADVTAKTLRSVVRENVAKETWLYTDSASTYNLVAEEGFSGHGSVNHSEGEYVRHLYIHTNTIESAFAILKRGIYGTFHSVSKAHLHRYLAEFDFRYNSRKLTDVERTTRALAGIGGKRLTYGGPASTVA